MLFNYLVILDSPADKLDDLVKKIKKELNNAATYLHAVEAKTDGLVKNANEVDKKVLIEFKKIVEDIESQAKKIRDNIEKDVKDDKDGVVKQLKDLVDNVKKHEAEVSKLAKTKDFSKDNAKFLSDVNLIVYGIHARFDELRKKLQDA